MADGTGRARRRNDMTRAAVRRTAAVAAVLLFAAVAYLARGERAARRAAAPREPRVTVPPPAAPTQPPPQRHDGFLYGRITAVDGTVYEGRLRWGAKQEAFWDDHFHGAKGDNPWLAFVPPERRPEVPRRLRLFGAEFGKADPTWRPLMVRFGDLRSAEVLRRHVRVRLENGAVWDLHRYSSNELDDGVRVWDRKRGVVDLTAAVETEWYARDGHRRIRTIEFLPTPRLGAVPYRLHGTVRTRQGDFTGFVAWDRDDSLGSDELEGSTPDGEIGVRFDHLSAIARRDGDSALVTLVDGREIVLSNGWEVSRDNRGIDIDDPRYGTVTVRWDAFERVDFTAGGSGAGYDDIRPGGPLIGSVTTRDGRLLAGRLVYDLDETSTTETLDGESGDLHYSIPFERIVAIEPLPAGSGAHGVRVVLESGEELRLAGSDDTGRSDSGVLVFTGSGERAEHVPWGELQRLELARPSEVSPPRF